MFDLFGYTVTKLRVFICSEINDCHKNGIVIGNDTLIVDLYQIPYLQNPISNVFTLRKIRLYIKDPQ